MKILIVDDLAVNRYLLESILRSADYEFVSTKNGIEALLQLRSDSFDVIISDILMPKMDGFQLLRECKKDPLLKKIPFIIYTATYTEKKDAEFGLSLGAIRYIIKPSEPDVLFQLIEEALSEHVHAPRDFSTWPLPDDETFVREYSSRVGAKLEKREQMLKESEEKYRLLYDNSMDAILLTSPDGSIQAANPAACAMFQQTEENLIRNGRDAIVDTADPRLPVALAERIRNGRFTGELTFLRKNGTRFPGEVSTTLFTDGKGKIRTSMIIRDISDRKQIEDALRESEELFRELFNHANDAIYLYEYDPVEQTGPIIEANEVACGMLQYGHAEFLKMRIDQIRAPEEQESVRSQMSSIIRDGHTIFETLHRRKDGTYIPVEVNSDLFTLKGRNVVLSIARDITERRKIQEEVRKSLVQIESDLEQMALFNDQIRNPLSVIIALLDREQESKVNTRIREQAYKINTLITTLDRQYRDSEKVREYLRKHYDFYHGADL